MEVRIETSSRLHFGFLNLSLARKRIYGGLGVAIDRPRTVIKATESTEIEVKNGDSKIEKYAERAVSVLDVDGVSVSVEREIPRHVGLGSGTRLALGILGAVAHANGVDPQSRQNAPQMGRGGRSGVGIATFEEGGFVYDAGHPSELFTSQSPDRGEWETPPVISRLDTPQDWRFVVAVPAAKGIHGEKEDRSIREVIKKADPSVSNEISDILTDTLLPGIASGDINDFGEGIEKVGRLNGSWYTRFQGGIYREGSRQIIRQLSKRPDVAGVGQSSWGPAVYALTQDDNAEEVADSIEAPEVFIAVPQNEGYSIDFDLGIEE